MSFFIECGGQKYIDKLQAINKHKETGCALRFETPPHYDNFNFSRPIIPSLEDLCEQQARKIRESHDVVVLWYSGGCDSHYILDTFLKHKIKIDKLHLVKSGFSDADFEIDQYAIPVAKDTGIPFEVFAPDIEYYKSFYLENKPMLGTENNMWHHFRLNNHFENLSKLERDGVAHVFGKEKPKLCYVGDKWYTYFLDVEVTNQTGQINFYCDDPIIYAKQCQMLVQEIEKHKDRDVYNQITHYDEHQDFWNRAIGRYTTKSFPMKELVTDGNFNNKDSLAIAQAPAELVNAWKLRNDRVADDVGRQYFNQGDPALGTIGVFSKFYCLTNNSIKTVDELFPDGFKIQ